MKPSPLRYALLLNGPSIQAWEAKVLEHLSQLSPAPEPVLLIYRKEMEDYSVTNNSWFTRFKKIGINSLFYHYYKRFFFNSHAEKQVFNSPLLKNVPFITVATKKIGKWSEHFDTETLDRIKSVNPDFILRFGFNIIRGEILTIPKFGVWSFHHDDEMKYRGSPAAFWEIYNGDPVTGAVLQRLTEKLDGGIILKKGYLKTLSHSYAANLDQVLFESSRWPALVCKSLIEENETFPTETTKTTAPIYLTPRNLQILFFLLRLNFNAFKNRLFNYFVSERWDLAILPRPIEEALGSNFLSNIFALNLSNQKAFYADPFGIQSNDKFEILTEKYDYKTGVGSLTSFQLFSDNKKEISVSGLPDGTHLSYPFLYEEFGKTYCIPESLNNNEIALYEAVTFPKEWKKVCTLVQDFQGVDATLFKHDNQYWLACTNEKDGPRSNLYLFFSKNLEGPYSPHMLNPVKTDIRGSRPAGTPFYSEGKLYRPAQDCRKTYGGAISINEILELTEKTFTEVTVKTLGPLPSTSFSAGMHTLSRLGDYTLVDGKVHRFNLNAFFRVLKLRFGW